MARRLAVTYYRVGAVVELFSGTAQSLEFEPAASERKSHG
jgi:hypothetical protein